MLKHVLFTDHWIMDEKVMKFLTFLQQDGEIHVKHLNPIKEHDKKKPNYEQLLDEYNQVKRERDVKEKSMKLLRNYFRQETQEAKTLNFFIPKEHDKSEPKSEPKYPYQILNQVENQLNKKFIGELISYMQGKQILFETSNLKKQEQVVQFAVAKYFLDTQRQYKFQDMLGQLSDAELLEIKKIAQDFITIAKELLQAGGVQVSEEKA